MRPSHRFHGDSRKTVKFLLFKNLERDVLQLSELHFQTARHFLQRWTIQGFFGEVGGGEFSQFVTTFIKTRNPTMSKNVPTVE